MEKPLSFGEHNELRGILHLPSDQQVQVGVVFVQGWSGDRTGPHRMFVHAARRFAGQGIGSMRFDLPGRGESTGSPTDTDLDQMIEATLTAADVLERESKAPKTYILGICSGGNVALGSASLRKEIDGLILWSTPLFAQFKSAGTELVRRKRLVGEFARKLFRRETYSKLFGGKLNWSIIAQTLLCREKKPSSGRNPKDSHRDIMSDLKGYRGPALFVYGSRDHDAAGAPEFFKEFCFQNDIPVQFHKIDGANHSFYSRVWEDEVIGLTEEWLLKRCQ